MSYLKLNRLTLLDGIAIILIVFYHSIQTFNTPDAIFWKSTIEIQVLGLVLFTFISGYKFVLNHINELEDKQFLKKYFAKRFIRLYKPYIGYSLLIFIPEYIAIYIATHYFKADFGGITNFWNSLNIQGLENLLVGTNFIAMHLWYLFSLLIITVICIIILYFFNIQTLFIFSLLMLLYNIISAGYYKTSIFLIDDRTMLYLPVFIFGMFLAYYKDNENTKKIFIAFSILFVIALIQIINHSQTSYQLTTCVYGLTFPCLMMLTSSILMKFEYINNILQFCGKYSFQIYLFHVPIIVPALQRSVVYVANLDFSIVPYVITILSIILSIYAYEICKKIRLNILFE
ncbi:acyltransferase family protein [Methanosarcina acetivorans]|nr:acyltransferase [Methanosarcina acetivorans]